MFSPRRKKKEKEYHLIDNFAFGLYLKEAEMTITSLTQSYRFFQREQGILESSRNVIFAACHTGFSQKDPVSAPDDIAPFQSVPVAQG